jgi:hypothetical protein
MCNVDKKFGVEEPTPRDGDYGAEENYSIQDEHVLSLCGNHHFLAHM